MIDTEAYIIEPEKKSRHYKWWFVGLGVLIALLGIACLVWPVKALAVIAAVAGACFLASGICGIVAFFDLGGFGPLSGWNLLSGIVDVLLGVMFLVHPLVGGAAMAWVAGIVVLVGGVMDIVASWRTREVSGTGMCALGIVGGIVTVVFGILMLAMPSLFIYYLGCMAIMRGLMLVVGAFQVSALIKDLKARIGA